MVMLRSRLIGNSLGSSGTASGSAVYRIMETRSSGEVSIVGGGQSHQKCLQPGAILNGPEL
eukprot:2399584-Amphidinium_carterae.1